MYEVVPKLSCITHRVPVPCKVTGQLLYPRLSPWIKRYRKPHHKNIFQVKHFKTFLLKIMGLWAGRGAALSISSFMAGMAPEAPVSNYCHWGSKTQTLRQPDSAPTQGKKAFQNIGYWQRLPKKLKRTSPSSPPLFSVWQIATSPNDRKQQNEKHASVCVCMVRETEH